MRGRYGAHATKVENNIQSNHMIQTHESECTLNIKLVYHLSDYLSTVMRLTLSNDIGEKNVILTITRPSESSIAQ